MLMNRVAAVNRVFLVTVIVSIVGSYINGYVSLYTNNYFVLLLLSQIVLITPSIIYFIIYRINVAEAIRFRKVKLSSVLLIVLFAFLIQPLMNLINMISMLFVQNVTSDIMYNIVENNNFLLSLLMIAFVPCVFEETVYRGVIYNEYSKVNPWKGILLSGFLFGIIHGNLNQFSYAFAMGIIFALLIEATNSILSTMIVHFIINGTSVVLLTVYPKLLQLLQNMYGADQYNAKEIMNEIKNGTKATVDLAYVAQYAIFAAFITVLAFIVFRMIAKKNNRWDVVKSIFHKSKNTEEIAPVNNVYSNEIEVNVSELEFNGNELEVNRNELSESSSELSDSRSNLSDGGILYHEKKSLITISLIAAILICIFLLIANEIFAANTSIQPASDGNTLAIFFKSYILNR
jgi:membrane protease YdiL (CAAX protease family)